MNFADRLISGIRAKNSVVCVGLDPRLDRMPLFLREKHVQAEGKTLEAVYHTFLEFNKGVIDAVADLVPAIKPQLAFYEVYGTAGLRAYEETCRYAHSKGLLVIADGKRNDIDSTAEAYAEAHLGHMDLFGEQVPAPFAADALTVNGYLGHDGILPFTKVCARDGKGIFVLVKTSNRSSGDLQDRMTVDEKISIAALMAHFVESWGSDEIGENGYSAVGAVVGATYPKELTSLRALMPNSFILIPGYGAQGGSAEDLRGAFDSDGLGAIVNNSRGVTYAYEKTGATAGGEDYAEAARDAVLKMNEAVNGVR